MSGLMNSDELIALIEPLLKFESTPSSKSSCSEETKPSETLKKPKPKQTKKEPKLKPEEKSKATKSPTLKRKKKSDHDAKKKTKIEKKVTQDNFI